MAVYDLVVVGGGFAGLAAAARFLADHPGASVKVLEASDRVGGRARDVDWPGAPGLRIDSGAQYVGDSQVRVLQLLHDLYDPHLDSVLVNGPAARWNHRHEVMRIGGRRYVYDNAATVLPGVPTQIAVEDYLGLALLVPYLEALEQRIDVIDPKQSASVWPETLSGLDLTSVATWIASFPVSETVRDLVRITVEALLSVDPDQISMLAFLWYTACNEGMMHAVEDGEGGPQQYWLRTGLGAVAQAWKEAKDLPVQTDTKVLALDASQPSVVKLTLSTGAVMEADRVVVALSPRAAQSLTYTPPLPGWLASTMSPRMGRTIKARLFYSDPWWRATNGFSHNGYAGGTGQPVMWVMDNSVLDDAGVERPCLMTFTVAGRADAWATRPDAEVLSDLAKGVRDLFNDERALHATGGEVHRWMAGEPIAGGGPSCFPNPGELTSPGLQTATAWDLPWQGTVRFTCSEMSRNGAPYNAWSRYNAGAVEVAPTYVAGVRTNPGVMLKSKYSDHRAFRGYVEGALRAGDHAGAWASATLTPVFFSLGGGGGGGATPPTAEPEPSDLPPLPQIPELGEKPALSLDRVVVALAVLRDELDVLVVVAQAAGTSATPYDVEAHTRAVSGVFELAALAAVADVHPLPPDQGGLPSPDPVGTHLADVAHRLAQAREDAGGSGMSPDGTGWEAVVRLQHAWSRWRAHGGGDGSVAKAFRDLQERVDERFLTWNAAAGAARQRRRDQGDYVPARRWPRFSPPGLERPEGGGAAAPVEG